jgi:hypothetical protein
MESEVFDRAAPLLNGVSRTSQPLMFVDADAVTAAGEFKGGFAAGVAGTL